MCNSPQCLRRCSNGSSRLTRTSDLFQPLQIRERLFASFAAHLPTGLQACATGWALGVAVDEAALIAIEVGADLTRGFALGHTREGCGDRQGDAAGPALLTTRYVLIAEFWSATQLHSSLRVSLASLSLSSLASSLSLVSSSAPLSVLVSDSVSVSASDSGPDSCSELSDLAYCSMRRASRRGGLKP